MERNGAWPTAETRNAHEEDGEERELLVALAERAREAREAARKTRSHSQALRYLREELAESRVVDR